LEAHDGFSLPITHCVVDAATRLAQKTASASGSKRNNEMADLEELHEQAEHGASNARLAPVTVSMAILAVIVAAVSLMGERIHANEMICERSYQVFLDQLSVFTLQNPAQVQAMKTKYSNEISRYTKETKDIQTQAYATEDLVKVLDRRSNWFDFSAVLLESSLVICSITLLTEKKAYWYLGLLIGASGICVAVAGLFIR
jgi:hypothetical protein